MRVGLNLLLYAPLRYYLFKRLGVIYWVPDKLPASNIKAGKHLVTVDKPGFGIDRVVASRDKSGAPTESGWWEA